MSRSNQVLHWIMCTNNEVSDELRELDSDDEGISLQDILK